MPARDSEPDRCPYGGVHPRRQAARVHDGDPGPLPREHRLGLGDPVEDAHHRGEGVAAGSHGAGIVPRLDHPWDRLGRGDGLHQGHPGDPVVVDPDELRDVVGVGAEDLQGSGVPHEGGHPAVVRGGGTAALHVPEDGDPGVLAESLGDQVGDHLGGHRLASLIGHALGHDHEVVPAARGTTGSQARDQGVLPPGSGPDLGDQDVVRPAGDGAHDGEVPAVPAHHLDDE